MRTSRAGLSISADPAPCRYSRSIGQPAFRLISFSEEQFAASASAALAACHGREHAICTPKPPRSLTCALGSAHSELVPWTSGTASAISEYVTSQPSCFISRRKGRLPTVVSGDRIFLRRRSSGFFSFAK